MRTDRGLGLVLVGLLAACCQNGHAAHHAQCVTPLRGAEGIHTESPSGNRSASQQGVPGDASWRTLFGTAINSCGDVDQDGREDFTISDPGFPSTSDATREGLLHVYSGTLPVQHVGTIRDVHGYPYASARMADVDADGTPDLLVGTVYSGAWYVSPRKQEKLRQCQLPTDGLGSHVRVCEIGDIDADHLADAACLMRDERSPVGYPADALVALSGRDGRLLWRADVDTSTWLSGRAFDVQDADGDGCREVAIVETARYTPAEQTRDNRAAIVVRSGRTGAVLRAYDLAAQLGPIGPSYRVDAAASGHGQLFVRWQPTGSFQFAEIVALDLSSGLVLWRWRAGGANWCSIRDWAVTDDANQDDVEDVVVVSIGDPVGCCAGSCTILSGRDGAVLASVEEGEAFWGDSVAVIGDLTGDDIHEIAVTRLVSVEADWDGPCYVSILDGTNLSRLQRLEPPDP